MSLLCEEQLSSSDDGFEDDLNLEGGLWSFEDPKLMRDSRVLQNLLAESLRCHDPNRADYFKTGLQNELKPHMRKIVADWMLEVTEEQRCHGEVFSLAMIYLDRVLGQVRVAKNQLQLLACVCMFLASKFKETEPLLADKLVVYTDFSITTDEITVCPKVIY